MAYTALPTKNPGDLLTSALWNTYLQGNADSGFMRMIADTTLGVAAATVDFTSIPQTFAHLILISLARDTGAGTTADSLVGQFNGDTAGNYDYETFVAQGITPSSSQTFGGTGAVVAHVAPGGSAAGLFAGSAVFIPNYASATPNKVALGLGATKVGVATNNLIALLTAAFWRSSAAINRLTLLSSSGSLAIGSRFTLYGLPR